jgi:hypothetical protein
MTPLNRDHGSTEPMQDPYTDAQRADVEYGLQAALRADALHRCGEYFQRALGASLQGDERSAAGFRADAFAALHMYPSLRIEVTGAVQPILNNHADARSELLRAKAILERVRDSAILSDTARPQRMANAIGWLEDDIAELEAGR